jgi:uncharacterized membrane protein (UPF0127 family)
MLQSLAVRARPVPSSKLVVLALALACSAAAPQDRPQKLPALRLNAGIHNIDAEVARTPEQRAIGLMNRPALEPNAGMLFVFEQAATQCFWMKNTLLPLSIAFVADDGTIVSTADMQPRSLASHCSEKPVRFALEMNQGWFDKRGLKAGSRLSGPAFQP